MTDKICKARDGCVSDASVTVLLLIQAFLSVLGLIYTIDPRRLTEGVY